MPTPERIVWLSSYPKSGNTWFRIVLSRLLNQSPNLGYINDMDSILGSPMVANRDWMNKALGFDSTLLDEGEIDQLRPAVYTWYAQQMTQTAYIKIHDAYTHVKGDTPLIPVEGCFATIYFIRNPLDIAISLAHHAKCPIDWSIHMMANEAFSVPLETHNDKQIRQKLLSWSLHVQSWVSDLPIRVLVIRYEDMFSTPLETFSKGLKFLNIERSGDELEEAIAEASFNKLQQYEQNFGFREKPSADTQFFRKGIVGDWRNTLSDKQVKRIIQDHGEMMHRYGYLDTNNQPV